MSKRRQFVLFSLCSVATSLPRSPSFLVVCRQVPRSCAPTHRCSFLVLGVAPGMETGCKEGAVRSIYTCTYVRNIHVRKVNLNIHSFPWVYRFRGPSCLLLPSTFILFPFSFLFFRTRYCVACPSHHPSFLATHSLTLIQLFTRLLLHTVVRFSAFPRSLLRLVRAPIAPFF